METCKEVFRKRSAAEIQLSRDIWRTLDYCFSDLADDSVHSFLREMNKS